MLTPRNGCQSRLITKMVPPAGKLNGTTNNTVNAIFMQLYSVETKMSNIRKGETVMTEAEFKKKVEQAMEKIKKEKEKKEFTGFVKQVDEHAEQSGNSVVYLEALTYDAEGGNVSQYINGTTDAVISMLTHALEKIITRKFPRDKRMPAIIRISKQLMKALDDDE
ncbi:MAG: hypothetical protein EGR90_00025 [Lachnospiraceae bacterium]|nr:hypothetical protein [Lachnospiraceae bacterium]